jgi:hypothetical protein
MTKLLDQAIEVVRQLPEDHQDELAQGLIQAAESKRRTLNQAQLDSIDRGIADANAGRFASNEEVEALRAKYRPV